MVHWLGSVFLEQNKRHLVLYVIGHYGECCSSDFALQIGRFYIFFRQDFANNFWFGNPGKGSGGVVDLLIAVGQCNFFCGVYPRFVTLLSKVYCS